MRRHEREQGAVAIMVCLVLVFVVLPASAAGLSLYVRQAAGAELQQAAEAGALAGAARLPLASTPAALDGVDDVLPVGGTGLQPALRARDARIAACVEARRAGSINDRMSTAFTPVGASTLGTGDCGRARFAQNFLPPPPATGQAPPLSRSLARVTAPAYVTARTQVSTLGACLDALSSPAANAVTGTVNGAVGGAVGTVNSGIGTVNGTVGETVGAVPTPTGLPTTDPLPTGSPLPSATPVPTALPTVPAPPALTAPSLSSLVAPLLPALVRPRLQVTTRHRVQGPVDRLVRRFLPDEQSATAAAERVFKNVVVVPRPVGAQQVSQSGTAGGSATVTLGGTTVDLTVQVPYEVEATVDDSPAPVTAALAESEALVTQTLDRAADLVAGQPVTLTLGGSTTTLQVQGLPGAAACAQALRDVRRDASDLVDPQSDTGTVLRRAATNQESVVFIVVDPTYASVFGLAEVCLGDLASGGTEQFEVQVDSSTLLPAAQCAVAGSGAFRAALVRP